MKVKVYRRHSDYSATHIQLIYVSSQSTSIIHLHRATLDRGLFYCGEIDYPVVDRLSESLDLDDTVKYLDNISCKREIGRIADLRSVEEKNGELVFTLLVSRPKNLTEEDRARGVVEAYTCQAVEATKVEKVEL